MAGGGAKAYVRDVRESQIGIWLGLQKPRMGKAGYNDYVEHIRAAFRLAVADRIIADSPAAALRQMKRDRPIRDTPTWEQFQAVVESIRRPRLHAECEDSADFVEFLGLAGLGNAEAAAFTSATSWLTLPAWVRNLPLTDPHEIIQLGDPVPHRHHTTASRLEFRKVQIERNDEVQIAQFVFVQVVLRHRHMGV